MRQLRKVYIAGPMTGYDEFNYPAFERATKQLRDAGYDVVSPHELNPTSRDWLECMRVDLHALIECEGVATLDGHEKSKGAGLETHIARELGLIVQPLVQWLIYQNARAAHKFWFTVGCPVHEKHECHFENTGGDVIQGKSTWARSEPCPECAEVSDAAQT
jgi:hypothetical protein